ncbi:major capsid protein P2 [Oxalicibacterium faecigallinarum]|uniref:Viral coat protein P2 N-terminal domain-containing protein n=1 Tax=Oxalicibacterium faecigallinarum TaxID=573741 RepID=A0A8J3AQD8_9BURK|nr:major capsid protein P2 [Oxalicibacterium faecigallinarum]GGI16905.1 hypothetical protein GCM10008066_06300 [Oxalicibacterium faecigallinarum]
MSIGRIVHYALPYSNVVATGTATNQITPGQTIECVRLKLGGGAFTIAMITRIKFKINGKTIIDLTGPQLLKINAYRGANSTDAKFLDIPFTDYFLNNEYDRMVGALDTSQGAAMLTTEVTIAGATAPELKAILMESATQKQRGGEWARFAPFMSKYLPYPFNVSTGGKLPIQLPVGQTGSTIKRIHVFHSGNMTGATVKQNSLIVHESVKDENEFEQKSKGRVPQTNMYTLDFVVDGDVTKSFNTSDAKTVELLLDFSAADSGEVIVEYLDPLANL